ncbi:hypothetical protein CEQ90_04395 [Lewinellaceae bacterium SD302]|nr:hypothetical protein CEQ90_04395 [Lewinellaceae bacterium SD302]
MLRTLLLCTLASFGLTLLSAQTVGHTQTGIASYYSDEFDGSTTAYKEIYNKEDLVAAHSLYPHNSRVRVTNLANNRDVTVRIIDEGPWIEGRIIEVSRRAAELLGFGRSSTIRVKLELISTPDQPARNVSRTPAAADPQPNTRRANEAPEPSRNQAPATPRTNTTTRTADREPAPTTQDRVVSTPQPAPSNRATTTTTTKEVIEDREPVRFVPAQDQTPLLTGGKFTDGVYKIELRRPASGNYGVQVASYSDVTSAMQEIAKLQAKWFDNILVRKIGGVYKVILGPFDDQASAGNYAKDLKKRYKMAGFTVELQ